MYVPKLAGNSVRFYLLLTDERAHLHATNGVSAADTGLVLAAIKAKRSRLGMALRVGRSVVLGQDPQLWAGF